MPDSFPTPLPPVAEGTGLPVLELPELVRRRFDLAALDELAGALAGAVSRNGRP